MGRKPLPIELKSLLFKVAPSYLWEAAHKQAVRSPMFGFRTGAVIFDKDTHEIVSKGCSHEVLWSRIVATKHAERHAIDTLRKKPDYFGELSIIILTLNKSRNFTWNSRPCLLCTEALLDIGIIDCIYPEKLNDNSWTINKDTPEGLLKRAAELKPSKYAREMRIL